MHMNLIFMGGKSLQVCHINDKMLEIIFALHCGMAHIKIKVLLTIYEDIHDCNTCTLSLVHV